MTAMPRPGFVDLEANTRILANIRKEMSLMRPSVQIQQISSFIYVRQRYDVGPFRSIASSNLGDAVLAKEFACVFVRQLTIVPNHPAAMLVRLLLELLLQL